MTQNPPGRSTPRRVRRPKDKESLLGRLVDQEQDGPFSTYKEVLVFAAALGYANRRREPFSSSAEPIPWHIFSGYGDEALINMLPIADEERLELLSPEMFDERLKWFEEYANGGLEVLQQRLATSTQEPLDVILDLILSFRDTEKQEEPDLSAFIAQMF